MWALGLAIACSASIALIFRQTEARNLNRYAVTTGNYLAACAVCLLLIATDGAGLADGWRSPAAFAEVAAVLGGADEGLSSAAASLWAVLLGLAAGGVFFLSFIFYQVSIRRHGVGLAGAFIKLGILVPLSLSLVLWREMPSALQWGGILLAVASIGISQWPQGGRWRQALRPALLMLFLIGGLAEFSNKVFQKYGLLEQRAIFLLATFGIALIASVLATAAKRRPVRGRELLLGLLVGVPNLFSSFFLIKALSALPAAVVFPVFGAGSIVILYLAGALVFREPLRPRDHLAIALTLLALILINA
jgi:drug/metabolite transporter (DMT)-like permease